MDKNYSSGIDNLLKKDWLLEERKYAPEIIKDMGFVKWYEFVENRYRTTPYQAKFYNLDRVHGLVLAGYILYTYHAIDKEQYKVLMLASMFTDIGYDGILMMPDSISYASALMLDSVHVGMLKRKEIKATEELNELVSKAKAVVRHIGKAGKSPSSLSKIMTDMNRMVVVNKDTAECSKRLAGMYLDINVRGDLSGRQFFMNEVFTAMSSQLFNTRYGYLWGIRNNWPQLLKMIVTEATKTLDALAIQESR